MFTKQKNIFKNFHTSVEGCHLSTNKWLEIRPDRIEATGALFSCFPITFESCLENNVLYTLFIGILDKMPIPVQSSEPARSSSNAFASFLARQLLLKFGLASLASVKLCHFLRQKGDF